MKQYAKCVSVVWEHADHFHHFLKDTGQTKKDDFVLQNLLAGRSTADRPHGFLENPSALQKFTLGGLLSAIVLVQLHMLFYYF